MNDKYYEANLKRWNELVAVHAKSDEYDLEGFLAGKSSLKSIEIEEIGDVKGKSLLHLQCHFGLDSLSWARMGAKVTGVDFAPEAVKLARELNEQLNLDAKFIEANIYDLPEKLDGKFDIVFTSYGVLCWLPDLDKWAMMIANYLKTGGMFYVAEFHPFAYVFNDNKDTTELEVHYDYFPQKEPMKFDDVGSYANPDAKIENTIDYEWTHSVSEIINSITKAGLRIKFFNEHDVSCYEQFPFAKQDKDGYYRLKNQKISIPLMFSLKAIKK
ncbi:MAG: class I SAM-dependent methyltransferase [Asgard group archaeon]|nr:class I SAM-dependent methyltransferase [Asgard group archaeon]